MKHLQIIALAILAVFYIAYFTKMVMQRSNGIKTDQIGKGSKPRKVLIVEILMKIATYSIVPVQIVSICFDWRIWDTPFCWIGMAVAAIGVAIFIIAMCTMRDSWRAGIPEEDKTDLITTGIYRFSRNPAFLGFDLMYVGLLISFFNFVHLIFAVYAVVMLHLQILQEEKYLSDVFGKPYLEYMKRTGRYFSAYAAK